ncbi:hypothetical protein QAD02_001113 [Eretmocerus hayati]|uniref:Uncharacterized protein n=1 Tax=Eretmocerus hayati TaxID=131215 RepID=A0ACC2NFJ1_9HYME|nr:hypothetical protein QAD02_001113 [Eretmocerus hayati]
MTARSQTEKVKEELREMPVNPDKEKAREERRRVSEEKKLAQGKLVKLNNTESNPCVTEHELSFKCMSNNEYDKEICRDYLDNYNMCRSFWNSVRKDRRERSIYPELPPPEERDKIKAEFFQRIRSNLGK